MGNSNEKITEQPKQLIRSMSKKALSTNNTSENIDETINILDRRDKLLENKIQDLIEETKKHMAVGNKTKALLCIKKKKMYETNLENIQKQKMNLETVKFSLEESKINNIVFNTHAKAGSELSATNTHINIDTVQDVVDTLQQTLQDQKQITEAISQSIDMDAMDDDELELELKAFMQPNNIIKIDNPVVNKVMPLIVPNSKLILTPALSPTAVPTNSLLDNIKNFDKMILQ